MGRAVRPSFEIKAVVSRNILPSFLVVDKILRVRNHETYFCQIRNLPQARSRKEVALTLRGCGAEGCAMGFEERALSQAVKGYAEYRLRRGKCVVLCAPGYVSDASSPVDVYVDQEDLREDIAEMLRFMRATGGEVFGEPEDGASCVELCGGAAGETDDEDRSG